MRSNGGTAAHCFFFGGIAAVDCCSFGKNGRSTTFNFCGADTSGWSFGFGCATVGSTGLHRGETAGCRGGSADGFGPSTAQVADVNSNSR